MTKNAFHFILKALKEFKFCPDLFGHLGKRFVKKAQFNLKFYDVINWEN